MIARLTVLALLMLLAACADGEGKADDADRDPAVVGALSDPIMADPDLASQNRGNSALQGGGPPSLEVPPFRSDPEEVELAKAQALELAGGRIAAMPPEGERLYTSRLGTALSAAAVAEALPELGKGCGKALEYGFIWAARLPAALPVYPRGHARQAAGSDSAACRIRVVNFVTPVSVEDVLGFYATLSARAGLAPALRREADDLVLRGQGKALGFAIHARPFEAGLTEVVLVTRER